MLDVNAYTIPTAAPESDGTAEWDSTTLVTVHIGEGFGYTYADVATALHVRIESMLFDGFLEARDGVVRPDLSRPGIGVELKKKDAERFK